MNHHLRKSMLKYILPNQKSFVVLDVHKPSPIYNITFMESNLQQLPHCISEIGIGKKFEGETLKEMNEYIKQVQKYQKELQNMRSKEIMPEILHDDVIKSLSSNFANLKDCLQQDATSYFSKGSIKPQQIIFTTGCLNILQFSLWNKLLMYTCQQYKNMSLQSKDFFMQVLRSYLNKYAFISTHKLQSNKFIMRETHLQDIFDFNFLFQLTQEPQLLKHRSNQVSFGTQLNLLKNRMAIIKKVSKSTNVNIYLIKQQFKFTIPQLLQNLDFILLEDILEFYHFYVKLSLDSDQLINKIENNTLQRITRLHSSEYFTNITIIRKILSIWQMQGRYNKKIMNNYILPFIKNQMSKLEGSKITNAKFEIWNNIAYCLICCGYEDLSVSQGILKVLSQDSKKKNQTYLISTQYLKLKTMKEKKEPIQLFLTKKNTNTVDSYEKSHIKKETQIQPIEFNEVEHFWSRMIFQAVPVQNVFKSQYISFFQIDILVLYKNNYFAFEVQGQHYRDPQQKSASGKKKIKEEILSCFGITTININCQEPTPKVIMRFKKTKDAKQFIIDKMEQKIKEMKKQSKENLNY